MYVNSSDPTGYHKYFIMPFITGKKGITVEFWPWVPTWSSLTWSSHPSDTRYGSM